MQKYITIIVFLLLSSNCFAQGHTFAECRLSKDWMKNTEGVSCPACLNKDKKEKEFKAAETKQRDIAKAEKIKAENAAKQKAFELAQKQKREEAAKAKSGEVVINAQPQTNKGNIKKPVAKTTSSKKDYSNTRLFPVETVKGDFTEFGLITETNDTIFRSNELYICPWYKDYAYHKIAVENIPKNVVIVQGLKQWKDNYNMREYYYYNLMNGNGEKLLAETQINFLKFCGSDFFIYTYYEMSLTDHEKRNLVANSYDWSNCSVRNMAYERKMVLYDRQLNKKYDIPIGNFACVNLYATYERDNTGVLFKFSVQNDGQGVENYTVTADRKYAKTY